MPFQEGDYWNGQDWIIQLAYFFHRDEDNADREHSHTGGFSPVGVDSSNTFGDDMLQMALKMATGELDEPAVDLEAALTPNTITATQPPAQTDATMENDGNKYDIYVVIKLRRWCNFCLTFSSVGTTNFCSSWKKADGPVQATLYSK